MCEPDSADTWLHYSPVGDQRDLQVALPPGTQWAAFIVQTETPMLCYTCTLSNPGGRTRGSAKSLEEVTRKTRWSQQIVCCYWWRLMMTRKQFFSPSSTHSSFVPGLVSALLSLYFVSHYTPIITGYFYESFFFTYMSIKKNPSFRTISLHPSNWSFQSFTPCSSSTF